MDKSVRVGDAGMTLHVCVHTNVCFNGLCATVLDVRLGRKRDPRR